jgi:hypothetical protein
MTLREWMNTFWTLDAPFDDVKVCEAVTGKTISNTSMGDQRYIPQEALERKIAKWFVFKRPYHFVVVVESKDNTK